MNVLHYLGIVGAIVLHLAVLTFGGLVFGTGKVVPGAVQDVELLSGDDIKQEEKPNEAETEEVEPETEAPPDVAEVLKNLESPATVEAPAMDAASLSAIEAALNKMANGTGDFASALDLSTHGRIGSTGKADDGDQFDGAFSLAEIDQKPRVVFQASGVYPASMRSKKIEGVVSVVFIVGPDGKVQNPRVEKSNGEAFEKPALDAVRRWKFEPAVKGGQRVACKMRVSIRLKPS